VITLVATSAFGCSDTLQQVVVVHPVPSASFQATPVLQQYPASTVTVVNTTPNGMWGYAWDFSGVPHQFYCERGRSNCL
jgi:hypothetical protein